MGVRWELVDDWVPEGRQWSDPSGQMPLWSTPTFRRAAALLPQHKLSHLVAWMGDDPVLSAPVLHSPQPGGLLFYDVPAMIGDDRAFGTGGAELEDSLRDVLYPSLAVGIHGAYHGILVSTAVSDATRSDVVAGLLDAVSDIAADLGCASSAVLYATEDLVRELRPADRHVTALLGAESRLTTDAGDFGGYLAELSSRRRIRIQRERRMYLEGDAKSEISTGSRAIGADLVDLRCNLRQRHGMPPDRERTEAEFAAIAANCGDDVIVNRSVIDGETVGFVINLRHGDTLYGRTAGFDYGRLGTRDFCYFNIVYYDMLEWGLPRGVRTLELGLASYQSKRTRGARFEPRFGVFDLPAGHPARTALTDQDVTERARIAAECGDAITVGDHAWT